MIIIILIDINNMIIIIIIPIDINKLRKLICTWAFKNLTGKTFTKEGLQATFTKSSIKKFVSQGHPQRCLRDIALLDIEGLLQRSKVFRLNVPDKDGDPLVKGWHYFEVDIYGTPSLINFRERTDGQIVIYTISKKGE